VVEIVEFMESTEFSSRITFNPKSRSTTHVQSKRDPQIELHTELKNFSLFSHSGNDNGNAALQWKHLQHLGVFFRPQNLWFDQQHGNNGRGRTELSVRLYNSFIEVKTEEDVGIVVASLPWS
jgi:hypothetical protein